MRDTAEIQEFTLEKIEKSFDRTVGMETLRTKIIRDYELDNSEREMLVDILSESLKDDMIKALKKSGSSLILEADVQSIYADAWSMYCQRKR